jgi:hypothetical protein
MNGMQNDRHDYIHKSELNDKIEALKKEMELKAENQRLQDTIDDLEDELDEIGQNPQQDSLKSILDLVNGKKQPTKENASISGFDSNKKESITNSIKILLRHDEQLDLHLKKLSDCAENNNTKFKMILNLLDSHL